MNVTQLVEYSARIVASRKNTVPYTVLSTAVHVDSDQPIPEECLLDFNAISECMKESGKDIVGMIPLQVFDILFNQLVSRCQVPLFAYEHFRDHSILISATLGLILLLINSRLPLI